MPSKPPSDGGVDVISGACAPPPPKGKPPKPKPKDSGGRSGSLYEDCATERILRIPPGVCTWFLVTVRGKRLSLRARRVVTGKLKRVALAAFRAAPIHTESMR
jgi:hypothetical protein